MPIDWGWVADNLGLLLGWLVSTIVAAIVGGIAWSTYSNWQGERSKTRALAVTRKTVETLKKEFVDARNRHFVLSTSPAMYAVLLLTQLYSLIPRTVSIAILLVAAPVVAAHKYTTPLGESIGYIIQIVYVIVVLVFVFSITGASRRELNTYYRAVGYAEYRKLVIARIATLENKTEDVVASELDQTTE